MSVATSEDYRLIQRVSELREFLGNVEWHDENDKVVFVDTEASSLDARIAKMAGFSVSVRPGQAIYVPVGHDIGQNMEIGVAIGELKKLVESEGVKVAFYNAKYDVQILETNANWAPTNVLDVMEYVYLYDSNSKSNKLKEVAKRELGEEMVKFDDLFKEEAKSKEKVINHKNPIMCANYACADADMTCRIYFLDKMKEVRERESLKFALKVDMRLVDVLRRMSRDGGFKLDEEYIRRMLGVIDERVEVVREMIYRKVGRSFDIESSKQLGKALFEEIGIPSQGETKTGQYKTDAETLESLMNVYPEVSWVSLYRKMIKARSTYFRKLLRLVEMGMDPKFNFNMFVAPTFRLAAPGGSPEKDGASGVNIQAVSEGERREVFGVVLKESHEKKEVVELNEGENFVGVEVKEEEDEGEKVGENPEDIKAPYVIERGEEGNVCIRDMCEGCEYKCKTWGVDVTRRLVGGVDVIPSVRAAFKPPDGYVVAAFDYDRQEIVIGANMSKEPVWLKALKNKEDIHAATAARMAKVPSLDVFGEEERKLKRSRGKTLNFAVFYGANEYTLSRKFNISIEEALKEFEKFKKELNVLMGWMEKTKRFARKVGYVETYFGRRRDLSQFYGQGRKMEAFADRSAVNTKVQGTGADILRVAMVKVDEMMRREQMDKGQARMVISQHDELIFVIKRDVLEQVEKKIRETMMFEVPGWEVQLDVGVKIGSRWGVYDEAR